MTEIQMTPVHAAKWMANSNNTAFGVERIGFRYQVEIFAWSSMAKLISVSGEWLHHHSTTNCQMVFIYTFWTMLTQVLVYILFSWADHVFLVMGY